jgi:hypothetical protein
LFSSFKTKDTTVTSQVTLRPEGYYYQAHYRIPIREFGSVNQDSHYDIILSDVSLAQADAMYIKLVAVRNANLSVGDTLYMCIDSENKIYEFVVTYIENRVTYYVAPKCPANDSPWHYFRNKTKETEEDEGKIETWIIVVIVVAVVLVIGISVGCWCWRRKKQLAAQNATTAVRTDAPSRDHKTRTISLLIFLRPYIYWRCKDTLFY